MHIPSFCQAAAIGMAFYAMTAVAAPVNEPDATDIAKSTCLQQPNVDSMPDMSNAAPKGDDKDVLLTTSDENNGITEDRSRRCRRDIDGKRRDCDDYYYGDDDYGRRGRGRGRGRGDGGGDYNNRAVQNEPEEDGKDLAKRRDDGPDDGGRRGDRDRGRGRGRGRGGRGGDYGRAVQDEPNKDAKDLGKRGYGDDSYRHHGDDSYGYHGGDSYGYHRN
ncbi:hypothetical protein CGRA01v4_06271 [Colletotrichum graminicola]|nr:hypothetical protein CGRA01v4_06271 [Colletotrichum graminicola]